MNIKLIQSLKLNLNPSYEVTIMSVTLYNNLFNTIAKLKSL